MGLAGRYTAEPSPLNEEELQIELSEKKFSPQDYARTLAERKAHAAMGVPMSNEGEVTFIIGSDTIVDLDGSISKFIVVTYLDSKLLSSIDNSHLTPRLLNLPVEKPKDEADAFEMIRRLSGNWHQVHTGVAVYAVGVGGHGEEKLMFSFTDTVSSSCKDFTLWLILFFSCQSLSHYV